MEIKEFLKKGGRLQISYKEEIMEWVGSVGITIIEGMYGEPDFVVIDGMKSHRFKIEELDKAIETFQDYAFGEKNIAPYLKRAFERAGEEEINTRNANKIQYVINLIRDEEKYGKK
jgi:hypothetical protein